ncbi:threonine/serine exporter family protein [Oscillospiraceae bacterium MB08-C2-2]|nr:threonine/serine exporter family protein [Oscillospiraceae bacterium MB08-C2-2]
MNDQELLNIGVEIGKLLLVNGGEIYRVEESMQRIFAAYGVHQADVFVIPSYIHATLTNSEGASATTMRRIYTRKTHLDRVERANDLCRRICRDKPDLDQIRKEIEAISRMPSYSLGMECLCFALGSSAFTMFFGGSVFDAMISAVCGVVIRLILYHSLRLKGNVFFTNIVASFMASLIAFTVALVFPGLVADKIIIGALMTLVPGIAITSFMRDIMAGDLMAGMMRLAESLMVAAAIALGSGAALSLTHLFMGGIGA